MSQVCHSCGIWAANSASVENSLVVPSYQLEIKTDDERLFQGDGLVPTFIVIVLT